MDYKIVEENSIKLDKKIEKEKKIADTLFIICNK
jgi:hypothetical protein